MTKISDLLSQGFTTSFEFFPPKTDEGKQKLSTAVDELSQLDPSFFSVTYGAGGTVRNLTRDVVIDLNAQMDFPTMPHLTCMGHSRLEIESMLTDYAESGVENVLSLAGDPPADGSPVAGDFQYASELVEVVRSHGDFSVGVAAFPEGHPRSASVESDRKRLASKLSQADFGITQFFFNSDMYFAMIEELSSLGCDKPVIPGIMPLSNPSSVRRFADMNGTTFPDELAAEIEAASPQDAGKIVVEAAVTLSQKLIAGGAPGIHLYALNTSTVPRQVVERLS